MDNILLDIYEGWKNLIFENPEIEAEAKRRMAICVSCPKLRITKTCAMCGCFMPAKVRNMKMKCGLEKW